MGLSFHSQDLSPDEVRRRFAWASRQGRPKWLWPDLGIDAWREALNLIEATTRDVLVHGACPRPLGGDQAALGLAAYTSGMGPLLGCWLEQGRIVAGGDAAETLALHLDHGRLRAERRRAGAVALIDWLAGRGVRVVVLKGGHTGLAYFPEPGARPASDLDLLAAPRQVGLAEVILQQAGFSFERRGQWESTWRAPGGPEQPCSLTLAHADDPWSVDLHSALDISGGPGGPVARLDLEHPLENCETWSGHPGALVLGQPLLLLHVAVHAGASLYNLTLLRLVELNLMIRRDRASGALDWDQLLAAGLRTGALGLAYPALALSEALAPGVVPARVLERCAAEAPAGARRVLARLTPANAQPIDRSSLAEHFMWARGPGGWARRLADDLLPKAPRRVLLSIYEARAWRLVRGRVTP